MGTPAEKEQVAVLLNQRMIEIFLDPQARSWYKLFVHMDDDCSGKVSLEEFEDMIRNELKISTARLSTDQLRAVWRSLDEDESGQITTGEFGNFMRLGSHVHTVEESLKAKIMKRKEAQGAATRERHKEMMKTWHGTRELAANTVMERTAQLRKLEAGRASAAVTRLKQQNAAAAHAVRQELEERLGVKKGADGSISAPPATQGECEQVALLLNQRMVDLFLDPQARTWYKLFIHMDDDCSGKVSFDELEDMIRNELNVSRARIPDEQLRSIWHALDEDKSGLITAGEFGHFMRLGAHIHTNGENLHEHARAKTADGGARRQEKLERKEAFQQSRQAEQAARRGKVAELYEVAWGMRAPADSRTQWRSPNARIY